MIRALVIVAVIVLLILLEILLFYRSGPQNSDSVIRWTLHR